MATKSAFASTKRLLWQVSCGVLLLLALAGGGALWYQGMQDAGGSLKDGRRLVIHLEDGRIEGFQARAPQPEDVKEDRKSEDEKSQAADDDAAGGTGGDKPKDEVKDASLPATENTDEDAKKSAPEKNIEKNTEKDAETPSDKAEGAADAHKEAVKDTPLQEGGAAAGAAEDKAGADKTDTSVEDGKSKEGDQKEDSSGDTQDDGKKDAVTDDSAAQDAVGGAIVASVSAVRGINNALTEKTRDGLVPRIGSDGTKPWKHYAKSASRQGDYPVIAIIVTGLGTGKAMTEKAIKLPENITLSFSPYARNVESWATAARVTGHEVMLDLPLQPADYPASDPGPYGLLTDAKPEANDRKLQWLLSRFGAFIGVLTPLSDGFVSDTMAFSALADSVAKRGLILALSRDAVKDQGRRVIEESTSPILVADVLLDEDLTESAIHTRLKTLQETAREKGYAIGIAQSYPVTMDVLGGLPARFAKEGFSLMPASYVARLKSGG